ncbi:unnamed protein product [Amoebophrya sp. A120]|nr:unnamed protein product [Amoebophrya sp. A120]|eukprot:GSA120T00022982001.1
MQIEWPSGRTCQRSPDIRINETTQNNEIKMNRFTDYSLPWKDILHRISYLAQACNQSWGAKFHFGTLILVWLLSSLCQNGGLVAHLVDESQVTDIRRSVIPSFPQP